MELRTIIKKEKYYSSDKRYLERDFMLESIKILSNDDIKKLVNFTEIDLDNKDVLFKVSINI